MPKDPEMLSDSHFALTARESLIRGVHVNGRKKKCKHESVWAVRTCRHCHYYLTASNP
jgi:hypothetical protein